MNKNNMNEEVIETNGFTNEDYDEFLDYLEDLDDDDIEDVDYEDDDEEETQMIVPKKKTSMSSPLQKATVASKIGGMFGGLSIGFGNGSGISFSENGVGINVTKETIEDIGIGLTKMQNRRLKSKIKKLKNKK